MRLCARPALIGLLGIPLVLGLTACAAAKKRSVEDLVVRGKYEQAVRLSAELLERTPDDPELQRLHREATVAFLLEAGRRLTFEDKDDEALDFLNQAYELDPDAPQVRDWRRKTQIKLASRHYVDARELHVDDHLVEAMEAYQRALSFDPELRVAREGLARVFLQLNYRDGLAEDYYNDGVRNLRQDELQISRSRFDYSTKYRPGDGRAVRRRDQVEEMLGRERISSAEALEEEGLFSAAEKEFAMALAYAPESETARVGLERTGIEARAARLEVQANQMILREEWERAREVLNQALELSQTEKARYEQSIATIDEARLEAHYEHALDLEADFRFADAIEAYAEILAERDFFLDVRSRVDTLQEYIKRAGELYEDAQAAASDGERLFYLLQIDLFWPEYEKVPELLAGLEGIEPTLPDEAQGEMPEGDDQPTSTEEPPVEDPADPTQTEEPREPGGGLPS